jgi:hypothetical protein
MLVVICWSCRRPLDTLRVKWWDAACSHCGSGPGKPDEPSPPVDTPEDEDDSDTDEWEADPDLLVPD